MVRVAKMAEVDELSLNPTGGHPPEILVNESNYEIFLQGQERALEEARVLGVNLTFVRPLDMGISHQINTRVCNGQ